MTDADGPPDQGKLLFGAGFAFGVAVTLLLLAVVLVAVASAGRSVPVTVAATAAGGVVFAAVVGAGLYYLSFPETRTRVAVDAELFGLDDDE